jgi:hypothetical protein
VHTLFELFLPPTSPPPPSPPYPPASSSWMMELQACATTSGWVFLFMWSALTP